MKKRKPPDPVWTGQKQSAGPTEDGGVMRGVEQEPLRSSATEPSAPCSEPQWQGRSVVAPQGELRRADVSTAPSWSCSARASRIASTKSGSRRCRNVSNYSCSNFYEPKDWIAPCRWHRPYVRRCSASYRACAHLRCRYAAMSIARTIWCRKRCCARSRISIRSSRGRICRLGSSRSCAICSALNIASVGARSKTPTAGMRTA